MEILVFSAGIIIVLLAACSLTLCAVSAEDQRNPSVLSRNGHTCTNRRTVSRFGRDCSGDVSTDWYPADTSCARGVKIGAPAGI